jgi:hypothetical protein
MRVPQASLVSAYANSGDNRNKPATSNREQVLFIRDPPKTSFWSWFAADASFFNTLGFMAVPVG